MPLRLLKTHSEDLELVDFDDDAYPPYAILSHVWEKGQEIEYHEIPQGQQLKHKRGWRKIAEANSAELAEALNSMFAWYRKANICYAYLGDVSSQPLSSLHDLRGVDDPPSVKRKPSQESPEEIMNNQLRVDGHQISKHDNNLRSKEFRQSRWFTRGWTLQELLAPSSLLFYDAGWNTIGSLDTAVDEDSTLAHKMSWAANRRTTRIEDRAYSLLGIFDISMAVIYGEGERAFRRLQEELMRTYTDPTIFAWQSQFEDVTATVPGAVVLCRCEDSRTQVMLLRLHLSISNEAYFASSGNRLLLLDIHAADLRSKPRTVNVWKNVDTQQHVETTALAEILVRAKTTPISAPRIEVLFW
ncbi:hypothetical protein MRB53_040036 [Persea americana]|nr:hypothetical protein MRB53_040036 [Persea americana]